MSAIQLFDLNGLEAFNGTSVGGGGGGGGAVSSATVTLTAAQIKALTTTPVTFVAGIANKLIQPVYAVAVYTYGTATYADDGSATATVNIRQANDNYGWFGFAGTGFLFQTSSQWSASFPGNNNDALANEVGNALVLTNTGAAFITGDGTVTVTMLYLLV